MHNDFTLDNKAVELPLASMLGFDKRICKRGDWLAFRQGGPSGPLTYGRSLGRVRAKGSEHGPTCTYIFVIALLSDLDGLMVRWVKPDEVVFCRAHVPTAVGLLLGLDMQDKEMVEKVVNPHLSSPLQFGTAPFRRTV